MSDRVGFDDAAAEMTGVDAGMAKRCYYEVLEVERTARDGELQSALGTLRRIRLRAPCPPPSGQQIHAPPSPTAAWSLVHAGGAATASVTPAPGVGPAPVVAPGPEGPADSAYPLTRPYYTPAVNVS